MTRQLLTRSGTLTFPMFVPVTTFGSRFPLDPLVRPYLPLLAHAALVSFPFAQEPAPSLRIPLFVDSGGFACLQPGGAVDEEMGLGVLVITEEGAPPRRLAPRDVIELQERIADVAFSLDFPIPPGMDRPEAERRVRLGEANALWALRNRRRRDLPLFAGVQGLEVEDYRAAARRLAREPFEGFAIGGLVPRARDLELLVRIVDAVRSEVGERPIHAFGMGQPDTLSRLFAAGVDSTDSSSYLRLAAEGRLWGSDQVNPDPSPTERMNLALCNLAAASGRALPLSAARTFWTHAIGRR
jgi:helicase